MQDKDTPGFLRRVRESIADYSTRWWREASGPINWPLYRSPVQAVVRRVMLWIPVVVLVLLLVAAAGFHAFTGWRARDLAARAVANAEEGFLQLAMVQAMSARQLRGDDPAVQKARAVVETLGGLPDSPRRWEQLPPKVRLSPGELRWKAEAMTRFGSEEQFHDAVEELEAAGLPSIAAEMRSKRYRAGGDLQRALVQARLAAAGGEPERRLELLHLLAARHGPYLLQSEPPRTEGLAAGREMIELVDALQGTPFAGEALAVGLGSQRLAPERARAWAKAAWENPVPSNPALLPAATALVSTGEMPLDDMRKQLLAVHAGAPVADRARLAGWFLRQGIPDAALDVLPPRDAAQDAAAFVLRSEALAREGRWEDLMEQTEAGSVAPASVRLLSRAQAAEKLGRRAMARKSTQDAIRTSVREGLLPQVLQMADSLGTRSLADEELLNLCSDPGTADSAFRIARERFGRRGQFASLAAAHERAAAAAPLSPAVADYRRFSELLAGNPVDLAETEAAVAGAPTDINRRITHALALLKAGQPQQALAVFDDIDVFLEAMPPGQQAVAIALLGANGDIETAGRAARRLDAGLLSPGEYALIANFRWAQSPAAGD